MTDDTALPCCPECHSADVALEYDADWGRMACHDCHHSEAVRDAADARQRWTIFDERLRRYRRAPHVLPAVRIMGDD